MPITNPETPPRRWEPLKPLAREVFLHRGRAAELHQIVDSTRIPMVWLDNEGRYLGSNLADRLFLRRTTAQMRRLRTYDLIPASQHRVLELIWSVLLSEGTTAGSIHIQTPDGAVVPIDYCGAANILPGAHLFVWMPSHWDADELGPLPADPPRRPRGRLTAREREVLAVLATGADVDEIAEQLALSPHTVKTHLRNAIQRLGARHRAQAVAVALREGEI